MLYKEELSTLSLPPVQIISKQSFHCLQIYIYTSRVIYFPATKATLHFHTHISAKPTINASASRAQVIAVVKHSRHSCLKIRAVVKPRALLVLHRQRLSGFAVSVVRAECPSFTTHTVTPVGNAKTIPPGSIEIKSMNWYKR